MKEQGYGPTAGGWEVYHNGENSAPRLPVVDSRA